MHSAQANGSTDGPFIIPLFIFRRSMRGRHLECNTLSMLISRNTYRYFPLSDFACNIIFVQAKGGGVRGRYCGMSATFRHASARFDRCFVYGVRSTATESVAKVKYSYFLLSYLYLIFFLHIPVCVSFFMRSIFTQHISVHVQSCRNENDWRGVMRWDDMNKCKSVGRTWEESSRRNVCREGRRNFVGQTTDE